MPDNSAGTPKQGSGFNGLFESSQWKPLLTKTKAIPKKKEDLGWDSSSLWRWIPCKLSEVNTPEAAERSALVLHGLWIGTSQRVYFWCFLYEQGVVFPDACQNTSLGCWSVFRYISMPKPMTDKRTWKTVLSWNNQSKCVGDTWTHSEFFLLLRKGEQLCFWVIEQCLKCRLTEYISIT